MDIRTALASYITEITGEAVRILPFNQGDLVSLPLYLRSQYDIEEAEIFGRKLILAFQKERSERPTPSEYANHARHISQEIGQDAVLIIPELASYTRNRLLRQGVAFVVPGRQMFLPTLMVDLRERSPRESRGQATALSAPSQVLVIFYLLGNPVQGVSLRELATRLGYSSMTLSNVRDELGSESFCQVAKDGRTRHLTFSPHRSGVWEIVKHKLRSPVNARHWVKWAHPRPNVLESGVTALARLTMLSEDPLPVFAMRDRDYRKRLETGELHGCPGHDEADAQVEAWKYDPTILARGETVDQLSLYLSLRESQDPRVRSALEEMMMGMQW